ncbi:MAG TPA: type II secretion system F family protein [Syntrophorhabdales bacterium]|nr:type II secretion system F family protein [Syntrophorhabdales bacterium]
MLFTYSALNKAGKVRSGVIEADAETSARNEIKGKGLFLVSLKAREAKAGQRRTLFSFGIKQKLPVQLARQLASLLKGGVPLFQALSIIVNQLDNQTEREVIGYMRDQVRGGTSLSEALKAYPGIFDRLFVYSVQAGEKAGALDSILNYQADMLENRAAVRGEMKTALTYPAIMVLVGTAVLLFLLTYVVPMVMKIFERMNQQLPAPTRLLLGLTDFVNNYLLVLLGVGVGFVVILVQWVKRSASGRKTFDTFLLKAPVYGQLYQMILISRFAKIVSTLLKSGVHMLQALLVVSSTIRNTIMSGAVSSMAEMVERGADLSIALRQSQAFPSYVSDMVAVGENSGNLEEMLNTVSVYYDTRAKQKIATMTAMVGPLIILALGAIIAFILVSILLPLFEMNKILMKG